MLENAQGHFRTPLQYYILDEGKAGRTGIGTTKIPLWIKADHPEYGFYCEARRDNVFVVADTANPNWLMVVVKINEEMGRYVVYKRGRVQGVECFIPHGYKDMMFDPSRFGEMLADIIKGIGLILAVYSGPLSMVLWAANRYQETFGSEGDNSFYVGS